MSNSLDLTKPTNGERLWAWRWAEGLSQYEAAEEIGDPRSLIQRIESDAVGNLYRMPRTTLVMPSKCRLGRRRLGITLAKAARGLKVSRVTYLAWERAADPRLVKWLEKKGLYFGRHRGLS